jgi:3-oxoacyl-[acyl-carrier protein] reductase
LDLGLQGRVAAVTGGSRGVGYAVAQALLAEGCRLAICARDKARLDAAARSLSETLKTQRPSDAVLAHPADVAKPGEVEDFVRLAASHFGGLDILVHNAGGGGGGAGLEAPDAEFDQAFELNVLAGLRAARAAVPLMRKRGQGRIIFISSVYGRESGGRAGYNVAKAAEISLAKALSRELAKDKILVNSVAPGSLMFPGSSWERRQQADPEGIEAFTKSDLPLGRFGKPEEVAAVVTFLASERASLVTGACWTVDGGQSRSLV